MLIPFGTDAPIYHRPFATVAIIVTNLVVYAKTGLGTWHYSINRRFDWLILQFDQINPMQWVTGQFMHSSWSHVIANAIFLWCFGIVVEGKIGWKKFSLLYLGMCLAIGATAQIPMFILSGRGGALGASAMVFALIAIAICWAPENDMRCIFAWSFWYLRPIEVPIFGLGVFYLLLELIQLALVGFHMSSPMGHLIGMLIGFPAGIYMLKKNLVDCEGWDVLSRWNNLPRHPLLILGRMFRSDRTSQRAKTKTLADAYDLQSGRDAVELIRSNPEAFNPRGHKRKVDPQPNVMDENVAEDRSLMRQRRQRVMQSFQRAMGLDKPKAAKAAFREIREQFGTHTIASTLLARYAKLLSQHKLHIDSLEPLLVLLSRRESFHNQVCLRVARIQFQLQHDPAAAAATIAQMIQPCSKADEARRERLLQALPARRTSTAVQTR